MNRERRNQRRGLTQGIIFLVIVLIIGLCIALVTLLPQFYIRSVDVEGNSYLQEERIVLETGIQEGNHLFYYLSGNISQILQLRYSEIEAHLIQAFPYIEAVSVGVDFPYDVRVNIEERQGVSHVATNDRNYVLDKEGRILEIMETLPSQNLPLILGLQINPELIAGEHVDTETIRQYERVLLVLSEVVRLDQESGTSAFLSSIEHFYPYSANTMYLRLDLGQGHRLDVKINPSQNYGEKLAWLANALPQELFSDLRGGVLDLSGQQNVFKPGEVVPEITEYRAPEPTTQETTSQTESEETLVSSTGYTTED